MMKRKGLIFLIAGAIVLSTLSGLSVLMMNIPILEEMEQTRQSTQYQVETVPTLIASDPTHVIKPQPRPNPPATTNGNSWGG